MKFISLISPHRCQAFCLTGFALVYMATVQQEAEQGACGAGCGGDFSQLVASVSDVLEENTIKIILFGL